MIFADDDLDAELAGDPVKRIRSERDKIRHRLRTLRLRLEYLTEREGSQEIPLKKLGYVRAEISALTWALPILTQAGGFEDTP